MNKEPGRRLDFQVAEEVLGWKRVTWEKGMTIFGRYKDIHLDRDFDVLGPPNWDGGTFDAGELEGIKGVEDVMFLRLPRFSTDIKDAFRVVNHFAERSAPGTPKKYTIQMEQHRMGCYCRIIAPGEAMVDMPTRKWGSPGKTIPHAICLAALKVVEEV